MQEYTWYAHGVFIRRDIVPEGLRRIWMTLYNANYKERILSLFELNKRWPLYTDQIGGKVKSDSEERLKMFRELKSAEAAAKDKIKQDATDERRDSSPGHK